MFTGSHMLAALTLARAAHMIRKIIQSRMHDVNAYTLQPVHKRIESSMTYYHSTAARCHSQINEENIMNELIRCDVYVLTHICLQRVECEVE